MNVWRERLQRWFTPLARRCPFSPNSITVAALVLNAFAATLFYFAAQRPALFLVAMGVVVVAGLADAFDGIVARVQDKQSRYGDFLDHFGDRVSDLLLIVGWMLGNHVRIEIAFLTLIGVMLNGYLGTQIEATWRERRYDSVGRGEFVLALIIFPVVSYILATGGWSDAAAAGLKTADWLTIVMLVMALLGIGQRLATARAMERQ